MDTRRFIRWTICFSIVVVIYHFVLRWLMLHHDLALGVVGPGTKVYRIVPIYSYIERHVNIWLVVCLGVVGAYLWWVKWVNRKSVELRSTAKRRCILGDGFAWTLVGWFLVIVVAVAMLDDGPERISRPFEVLHDSDYIGGVELVESPRSFLKDYVETCDELPMHCQTHPPGAVLFLWAVDRYIKPGPVAASVATILFAALSVPAVVGLARKAAGERLGRLAGCLFLLAPNVALFTATSMEAVFMVPMVWTVYLLFCAFEPGDEKRPTWRPWVLGVLAGLCASIAAMMTFSVALIAGWAIFFGVWVLLKRPDRFRETFIALVMSLVTSVLFYLLIYFWSGYNLIEVLHKAAGNHELIMSGGNYGSVYQYCHLVLGNLVAFLVGTGVSISVLFLFASKQDIWAIGKKFTPGRLLNIAFLSMIMITLFSPLYTLEVERIWIFLVPFLTIGAVRCFEEKEESVERTASIMRLAMVLSAVQLVVMETFLETLW